MPQLTPSEYVHPDNPPQWTGSGQMRTAYRNRGAANAVPTRLLVMSMKGPTCWAQLRGTPPPIVKIPRRLAVPYFAIVTGVGLVLTLATTPLHEAFYLLHGYRELHEHDPWRAIALVSIGPAMLSGAAVHALLEKSRSVAFVPLIVAMGGLVGAWRSCWRQRKAWLDGRRGSPRLP